MSLTRLEIKNIRNIQKADLDPGKAFNLIYGNNGSGKTSLLEAIYMLGLGRSFRTLINHKLIKLGEDYCSVFARSSLSYKKPEDKLAIQKSLKHKALVKINGELVKSASSLAEFLPLQLITPHSYELIVGPRKIRRQFMDWGVFHVEHHFLDNWRLVQRHVEQRNALLKAIAQKGSNNKSGDYLNQINSWNQRLIEVSEEVDVSRSQYLKQLEPYLMEYIDVFLPGMAFSLTYYAGWPESDKLSHFLDISLEKDIKQGYTFYGPNRADIKLKIMDKAAADILSRGQMKLLVCALKLAQARLLYEQKGILSVFLIDDLASELDPTNRAKLCASLKDINSQVFITSVDKDSIIRSLENAECKMFHVEHGEVSYCAG